MKKLSFVLFLLLLSMAGHLNVYAVGQKVIYTVDYTAQTESQYGHFDNYPYYTMGRPNGSSHGLVDGGLQIENRVEQENDWDFQLFVADWISLKEQYDYIVRITYRCSDNGSVIISMGDWGNTMNKTVDLIASESERIIDIVFSQSPLFYSDSEHIIMECGKFVGTILISKVEVIELTPEEAYAVLSTDKTTLTFYYDEQKNSREGMVFTTDNFRTGNEYGLGNDDGWSKYKSDITTVVFNESFSEYNGSTDYWFWHCENLKTIEGMGYLNVMSIGEHSFEGCTSLTSVTISNSVVSIEEIAFGGCHSLTSVTIPNSVKSIGKCALCWSGLTTVIIPNSVTTIGEYAFTVCRNLADVYCYAKDLPITEMNVFVNSNYGNATLHVPFSAIDAYRTTAPWSGFGTIVPIEDYEDDLQSYLNSLEDTEDSFDGSTYRREFKNGDWQALYVPFEMNYSDWSAEFDVAEIKGLRKYDGYIALEASIIEDGKLEANYPYLIRAKSERGATLTVNVTGEVTQVINSVSCKKLNYWEGLGLEIKGNYSKMTGMKSLWYRRMQGGTLSISNSDDEVLQPYRWYGIPTNTTSRELRINIENEEATAISNAAASDTLNAPAVYDLQGRRMKDVRSLPGGMYIVNGNKRVVTRR